MEASLHTTKALMPSAGDIAIMVCFLNFVWLVGEGAAEKFAAVISAGRCVPFYWTTSASYKMEKEKRIEILGSAGRALLELVPYVGGSISSVIGDYQAERKHQRLIDLFESLKHDLEKVKNSINKDFVAKDDFLDIFEATADKIVNERTIEKRTAFKNILVNSTIRTDVDYDEVEEHLRLLGRLRKEHLLLLKILADPIAFDSALGSPVGEGGGLTTSLYAIMRKLLPTWKPETVLEVSSDLQGERLIKDFSNNLGTMMTDRGIGQLRERITEKGKRFYKFVTVE